MPDKAYEVNPAVASDTQGLAIIMRGLPGSGKSHWVNEFIARQAVEVRDRFFTFGYFSTDSLFYRDGVYQFDVKRLSEYHQRNLTGFIQALSAGEPIVICDNTNLTRWESMAYEAAAKALGFQVRYVLMGDPKDSAHQAVCAKRNSHGVPLAQIIKMANSFEEF
ncbi:ATP-binding protein [Shewanella nanhaiensis]|uniref:ATP-binding protein n=1 Tax=Shewanella nanhaiensis TaxID=2864872 RepID=A0ABS7E1Y4_9GAMM|nr:ATP-binding protein [Shewanella nanhaiensis]MBW8183714.1 ATP-binding protein [Shewanella nanhaiensis]